MRGLLSRLAATGCMLVVPLMLWAAREWLTGDLAAFVGVLIIWLCGLVGMGYYVVVVLQSPYDSPERLEPIRSGVSRLNWLWQMAATIGPGLWIGLVASFPLALALACLSILTITSWLIDIFPSQLPVGSGPPTVCRYLHLVAVLGTYLLAATVAGVQIRAWLHW